MRSLAFALVVVLLAAGAPRVAATTGDVGYRGPSLSGSSAPTGQKPQSKLWWNDGIWWGALFNASSGKYEIHRLDWATQAWSTTGVLIDQRSRSQADVLWEGGKLYIASAIKENATSGNLEIRFLRYSYDPALKQYALDPGFPVVLGTAAVEVVVIDRDSTGTVWATWPGPNSSGGRRVMVTHTDGSDDRWIVPYTPAVTGAATLHADDLSTLVAYRGKIGVLWSNQNDDTFYFASHVDGRPDSEWDVSKAYAGPKIADDHMNIKSLQADESGEVFAVVKTSLNDVRGDSSRPLVVVLTLKNNKWLQPRTVATVEYNQTRPIVLVDTTNRLLHVFMAGPCCSGGVVYHKSASLDTPSLHFPAGPGDPFIKLASDATINNPTSTKQTVSAATGLVVLAGDDKTKYYVHNAISLAPTADTTAPVVVATNPAHDATGVAASTTVTANFSEPVEPTSVTTGTFVLSAAGIGVPATVAYDATAQTAALTPSAPLAPGTSYTATLKGGGQGVRDASGNALAADYVWTFSTSQAHDTVPPTVSITAPASGSSVSGSVEITAEASDDVAVATVEFAVNGQSIGTDETAPYAASWEAVPGTHTLTALARDTAGNSAESAPVTVSMAEPPGVLFEDGFESGALDKWQVVTKADGVARVQSSVAYTGSFAAELSESDLSGSVAYARADLVAAQSALDISAMFNVEVGGNGTSSGNVPLLRLFDAAGSRMLTLYRQNGTSNRLYINENGTAYTTSGVLPLGRWASFDLRVSTGAGTARLTVLMDGVVIYERTGFSLAPVRQVQIGNETARQTFRLYADDISVTAP